MNQESVRLLSRVAFWGGGHKSAPVSHKHMLSQLSISSPLINEDLPAGPQLVFTLKNRFFRHQACYSLLPAKPGGQADRVISLCKYKVVGRNYIFVLLPLYCTFSLTSFPLPPSQCTLYCIQTVCDCGGWGDGGCWNVLWTIYSAGVLRSVSDQIQNPQNCFTTQNKNDQERRHWGIGVFKVPSSMDATHGASRDSIRRYPSFLHCRQNLGPTPPPSLVS